MSTMLKTALALVLAGAFGPLISPGPASADESGAPTLGAKTRAPVVLDLTAEEAGRALAADPGIVFIDVRDPIEVSFVGHAEPTDANVPWRIATHAFQPSKGRYGMASNDAFLAEVEAVLAREGKTMDDRVFLICRSGNRSQAAAIALAEAGFTNVWNVTDGFEGDKGPDGVRDVNGWRNAGLPWAYALDERTAWTPPAR
ncbi:MAG: rhodanese-like domain-containing protein [Pseudomonadota bacterium]